MKNTNGRSMIVLAVFSLCFFCIVITCIMLIMSGQVSLSVYGFAVDNAERLYIGNQTEIQVYENGILIDSIHIPASRTYVFTIQEGNTLLLATSTKTYVMDLDGNILEIQEDLAADAYNQISYRKRTFISDSGDTYELSNFLGQAKIIRNKTDVVYQMDGASFVVKALMVICCVAMVGFAVCMLSQKIRKPDRYSSIILF